MSGGKFSRRRFLARAGQAAGAGIALSIVPRHVLAGGTVPPPSETITRAVVGTGGMGMGHVAVNEPGRPPVTLAVCDVDKKRLAKALQKAGPPCQPYSDFRRVLDRRDIDTIEIATPPHWHALVSIAAAESGRDVLCEKPMTRFIAEGPAVIDAINRNGRVFQIGTYGRYSSQNLRKLVMSGRLGEPLTVRVGKRQGYDWKVKMWSGRTDLIPTAVPEELDYNMWLGPAPVKPYHPHRVHGSFRCYWDYEGGGLGDMGQHYLDPVQYWLGKDDDTPVEVEAVAPPAHPEAAGLWGKVTLKYADGTTIIITSGEWGEEEPGGLPSIEGPNGKVFGGSRSEPAGLLSGLDALPDPPRLVNFPEAVKTRQRCGGNQFSSHRSASLIHLANIAIRTGRKLTFDPKTLRFVGDEEANRLVELPMRAPWHL